MLPGSVVMSSTGFKEWEIDKSGAIYLLALS